MFSGQGHPRSTESATASRRKVTAEHILVEQGVRGGVAAHHVNQVVTGSAAASCPTTRTIAERERDRGSGQRRPYIHGRGASRGAAPRHTARRGPCHVLFTVRGSGPTGPQPSRIVGILERGYWTLSTYAELLLTRLGCHAMGEIDGIPDEHDYPREPALGRRSRTRLLRGR